VGLLKAAEVDNVGHRFEAICVGEARCHTIVVELDPLGQTRESVAAGDVEVGNVSIVEGITLWSPLEGLLVLHDAVL